MPSTATTRLRLEKQALGENLNTWGSVKLNDAIDRIDEAIAGVQAITISGASTTLTSVNYSTDQARKPLLVLTGTLTVNSTITVPNAEKLYVVVNNTTQATYSLTIKTAAGSGYALRPGPQMVYCNGTDVFRASPTLSELALPTAALAFNAQRLTDIGAPAAATDAATRKYVDDTAFSISAGSLPGQAGNAGKYLTTDGSTAGWASVTSAVTSVNGSTGTVVLTAASVGAVPTGTTYTAAQVGALALSGGTLSGSLNLSDQELTRPRVKDYALTHNALGSGSGARTINLELGNYVSATVTGNTTWTFSNPPASPHAGGFVLELTNGGAYTMTWPSSVKWPGGSGPTLTASGVDVLAFLTRDGGTTWRGALSMANSV
jgi:hypothetical protein